MQVQVHGKLFESVEGGLFVPGGRQVADQQGALDIEIVDLVEDQGLEIVQSTAAPYFDAGQVAFVLQIGQVLVEAQLQRARQGLLDDDHQVVVTVLGAVQIIFVRGTLPVGADIEGRTGVAVAFVAVVADAFADQTTGIGIAQVSVLAAV